MDEKMKKMGDMQLSAVTDSKKRKTILEQVIDWLFTTFGSKFTYNTTRSESDPPLKVKYGTKQQNHCQSEYI